MNVTALLCRTIDLHHFTTCFFAELTGRKHRKRLLLAQGFVYAGAILLCVPAAAKNIYLAHMISLSGTTGEERLNIGLAANVALDSKLPHATFHSGVALIPGYATTTGCWPCLTDSAGVLCHLTSVYLCVLLRAAFRGNKK